MMNTFSTILATFQSKIKAVSGNKTDTQEALIDMAVELTNLATHHGKRTKDSCRPKEQTYWSSLYVWLRESGFELLGSGFFSLAVSHPALPERVLKVGLKKEDSAAAYTAWCRINQGKTGVPNIHATRRSTGCYVVVLDELFPLDLEKLNEFKGYRTARAGLYDTDLEYPGELHLKALYETAASIRDFFKGLADFDLHEENVMVDGAGNVIITDPVSYSKANTRSSSWALMDNTAALTDLQKERIAQRARERNQRNQKRQQIRKEQKARLKALKAREAKLHGWLARVDTRELSFEVAPGIQTGLQQLNTQRDPRQLDPALIKRINGLDAELQAQLRG